jgi:hypothetical protein
LACFWNEQREDPKKALNMKLNKSTQGEGLIPRREHQVREDVMQVEGITWEQVVEGKHAGVAKGFH